MSAKQITHSRKARKNNHSSWTWLSLRKPPFVETSLLELLLRWAFCNGSMSSSIEGALESTTATGEAIAWVETGEDGGVDCVGTRLRKVDSRR